MERDRERERERERERKGPPQEEDEEEEEVEDETVKFEMWRETRDKPHSSDYDARFSPSSPPFVPLLHSRGARAAVASAISLMGYVPRAVRDVLPPGCRRDQRESRACRGRNKRSLSALGIRLIVYLYTCSILVYYSTYGKVRVSPRDAQNVLSWNCVSATAKIVTPSPPVMRPISASS